MLELNHGHEVYLVYIRPERVVGLCFTTKLSPKLLDSNIHKYCHRCDFDSRVATTYFKSTLLGVYGGFLPLEEAGVNGNDDNHTRK